LPSLTTAQSKQESSVLGLFHSIWNIMVLIIQK